MRNTLNIYQSWGNFPKAGGQTALRFSDPRQMDGCTTSAAKKLLPRGLGRSYGDVCLNSNGTLLDMTRYNKFIRLDSENCTLECEAGCSVGEILRLLTPHHLFLPVVPGTQHVTIGGAIANDIHGKNHHVAGTFGNYVLEFELLRSNGERLCCSREENSELFFATIGGLGLTGLILSAKIQLIKIRSAFIDTDTVKFENIDAFWELSQNAASKYEYIVAWIDCFAEKEALGKGILYLGNHSRLKIARNNTPETVLNVPVFAPNFLLNPLSLRAFNKLYFHRQLATNSHQLMGSQQFFFPLDSIKNWNRLYGKRGFLQWQCVVPDAHKHKAMNQILNVISTSGQGVFLSVLKEFGGKSSGGLLSFPMPGATLAMDFPNTGEKLFSLLNQLDEVVAKFGGRIYPAKDARMRKTFFENSFPNLEKFKKFIDPAITSNFAKRMGLK